MTPDLELLAEALGSEALSWKRSNAGGYTRSRAWRVATTGGDVFVKGPTRRARCTCSGGRQSSTGTSAARFSQGSWASRTRATARSSQSSTSTALTGLRRYPDDVTHLFDTLDLVARTVPPADLPAEKPNESQWRRIAADPEPFLGLGLCSREWLDLAIDPLIEAENRLEVEGDDLVHNDVYSANVAFHDGGVVLVDWGAAVRGSRWVDFAFALLSLRVEGAARPVALAATIAGHFAVGAPGPLPDWAEPGSTFLEDISGDLSHLLRWAAEQLELPPPPAA